MIPDKNLLWTIYTAPVSVPMVETITTDGVDLAEPEGYEAVADRITIDEDNSSFGAFVHAVMLTAKEEGFVLDRLASVLDSTTPSRLLLVGYPEDGVCNAILWPNVTREWWDSDGLESRLMVVASRPWDCGEPLQRIFWFGPNFRPEDYGFTTSSEEAPS